MPGNNQYKGQMEINDLIDNAISNAVARRELAKQDALLALSDDETAAVMGGFTTQLGIADESLDIAVAGYKPIKPPIKHPIQPLCPPIIVTGLIAVDKELV
jgi:hypothetical protein